MEITVRQIRIEGKIAYVPLTQGYEAIIDADDAHILDGFNWRIIRDNHTMYAVRSAKRVAGETRKTIYMHRTIMGAESGFEVDHISGEGLDNRRKNMRVVTHAENQRNQRLSVRNKIGMKGVSWHAGGKKWQSHVVVNRKTIYLGLFEKPEDAHAAYADAMLIHHGEFGRLS